MTPDELLLALDPEQRRAVEAPWGPVRVLAGAGTGKTRALTHRIALGALTGQIDATRVLAVTFTARAAGEMRTRLRDLGVEGVQARTFHSAALRQLRYFWPTVVGGAVPAVIPHKAGLVAEAATRCRTTVDRSVLRDLAGEIEWAKVSQIAPADFATAVAATTRVMPGGLPPQEVARIYGAYDDVKRGRGVIDFEDVLLLTAAMLDDDSSMARKVRAQYQHFLVDEYQDVSPVQQRLLDLWMGQRDDVTVVGDAAQTIYSFTGSSPRLLLDFSVRYPTATTVELVRNYRSTPQIVSLANRVLSATARDTPTPAVHLRAQLSDGPEPTISRHPDEATEATAVATRAQQLIASGTAARDIAVLYRINALSESFEDAFTSLDVPYVMRGSERFFDRPEVRQAITLLKGAARSGQAVDEGLLVAELRSVLTAMDFSPQAPVGPGAVRERWESLAAIVSLAEEFEQAQPGATLTTFLDELDLRSAAQHAPTAAGVTLSTLHAAKGLEWKVVFLVGLVEGTLPISYATTAELVAEERRLFYVGITRAQDILELSYASARSSGSRSERSPSSFLRDAGVVSGAPTATPPRRSRRQRVAVCSVCGRPLATAVERKLEHCSECEVQVDVALFERLREWRLSQATQASVPAYVVFTDATLTAIASKLPSDETELAQIPGIGKHKLERYGAQVLAVVAERDA